MLGKEKYVSLTNKDMIQGKLGMEKVLFRGTRKLVNSAGIIKSRGNEYYDESYVQIRNQDANDAIRNAIINSNAGLMITKFGTVELSLICCDLVNRRGINYSDYKMAFEDLLCIVYEDAVKAMCNNAGFFPASKKSCCKYTDLVLEDTKQIDFLGSYLYQERYIEKYVYSAKKVNLEGYYAPFLWENPWTMELKNKKVLVVHPFVETIKQQYEKRKYLFENKDVLPEFSDLILIKAVQSIAGNGESSEFASWFDALESMKNEMDNADYDIALIGCGAYGMSLAAHAKRKGKIAIHLAGWTQMLFGIYGNRWINDQPEYKKYINSNWTRPSEFERPKGAGKVEGGCYW